MSAPEQAVDGHPATLSTRGLGRRMFRNTAALVVGRNLNSLGRLVVVALITRTLGTTVFGEYALIVAWLTIAEWILDFGTTDVFVREANRAPERRSHLVRVFLALKVVQAPLAVLVLTVGLVVMGYSGHVITAGLLGSVSLFFLAGVALFRASFKAALLMEREVFSESFSVLTMLGLLLLLPRTGFGLMGLMGAYVISRAVYLVGCIILSRGVVELSVKGVRRSELKWAARASFAIGLIGFIVVLHNATDLLILSRLSSLKDVAIYSAAQRFTIPLMMGMHAISVSFYPVLAFLASPERFREVCKHAVTTTFLLSGLAVVFLWCGAEFLMGLLGTEFVAGADVLRVLAVMCGIKAVSLVAGPVLFLVGAENYALAYMVMALLAKVGVLTAVAPKYGYMGVALGTLAVETLVLAPATLSMVYRRTGFFVPVLDGLRVVGIVVVVILTTGTVASLGSPVAMLVAAPLYVALALLTRAVRISEIRRLLGRGGERLP